MNKTIWFLQSVILYLFLFVMALSYHPTIMSISQGAGYEVGTVLTRYILVLFAALFACSILRIPRIKSRLLISFAVGLFLITVSGMIILAFYNNQEILQNLRSYLIVFIALLIGWTLTPTENQLSIILMVFGITVVLTGVLQIRANIGGFIIADQYLVDSKNSLGAMLATAAITFLFMWKQQRIKIRRLLCIALFFFTLFLIITIRARAALLATLLVGLFFVFHYISRRAAVAIFALIPVALVIIILLPSSILDYFHASIFAGTQGDDVTSGRMGTYMDALQFVFNHPFFGDVENRTTIGWIHNFPLLKIYQYGLVFSLPILALYLYILIHSLKESNRLKDSYHILGHTVILVPFVISLLEPTFPFGPGTVTVYNYILLGLAERYRVEFIRKNNSQVEVTKERSFHYSIHKSPINNVG